MFNYVLLELYRNYYTAYISLSIIHHLYLLHQNEFSYLASGSRDRNVKLWDALTGACLSTFTAHENWVRSVVFHPSYKYIISCSDDKTIRILDIKVHTVLYCIVV